MNSLQTIFLKTLRKYRNLTLAVSIGTAIWAALVVGIYPSYSEGLEDFEIPAAMQGLLGEAESFSSPEGFLATEFFTFGAMLIIAIAITGGSASISGEEESGMLDLLLAQPIQRSTLVLAQVAGLATLTVIPVMTSALGFVISLQFVEMEISSTNIYAACASMWPVSFLFLGISVLFSSSLPTRSSAAMMATGFLIASFLMVMLGEQVPLFDTVKKLSPFYWSDPSHVLINGFNWARTAGFTLITLPLIGLSLWFFEQRDISVGLSVVRSPFRWNRGTPAPTDEEAPQTAS